jgi:hypothetical protein
MISFTRNLSCGNLNATHKSETIRLDARADKATSTMSTIIKRFFLKLNLFIISSLTQTCSQKNRTITYNKYILNLQQCQQKPIFRQSICLHIYTLVSSHKQPFCFIYITTTTRRFVYERQRRRACRTARRIHSK